LGPWLALGTRTRSDRGLKLRSVLSGRKGRVRPAASCRDAALASLARRALTRKELASRLARKGYSAEEVAKTLDALEKSGLVDDARAAESHAAGRAARGLGRRRIASELVARGVPEAERAAALAGLDPEDEKARLSAALAKRARALPAGLTGEARSRRLFAHLVRRGFAPDAVLEALGRKGDDGD
jgi:regulatory protein